MTAATNENIRELEAAIGLRLPEDVRAKYCAGNGFLGPIDCKLLYPWKADPGYDIVSINELRAESWFPPQFQSLVLVGDDGCGNMIGYDWQTRQALLWNPEDGDYVQQTRDSVSEIWQYVVDWYAELPEG